MLCLNVSHDFSKQLIIEKRIEMSNSKSVSKKHIVYKLQFKTVNVFHILYLKSSHLYLIALHTKLQHNCFKAAIQREQGNDAFRLLFS